MHLQLNRDKLKCSDAVWAGTLIAGQRAQFLPLCAPLRYLGSRAQVRFPVVLEKFRAVRQVDKDKACGVSQSEIAVTV